MKHTYLNRSNLEYIEEQYQQFLKSPETVGAEWRFFFEGLELGQSTANAQTVSRKEFNVIKLIQAYRDHGHFEAKLNPLSQTPPKEILNLQKFSLTEKDLESSFEVDQFFPKKKMKLKEIVSHLKGSYCETLSVQISDSVPEVREWFLNEVEKNKDTYALKNDEKVEIYNQLIKTEALEKFLHTRFVGAKRFSIEGSDALIPMLERLALKAVPHGIAEVVIGMAHRGRINVLTNFMGKGTDVVLAKFQGVSDEESSFEGGGDVKYHLGFSSEKTTREGTCHLSLAFNPSHLEAVNPVVLGMTRAKQRIHNDTENRKKVVPVLIHGDAAFAGQGVVAETFQLSQLKGYTIGGTIHVITDNQVGFTTNPSDTRSSPYASDNAKSLLTPVIHVNGDDVEACVRAMEMALKFRQKFGRDVVINLIGYRRFGHNEGDEPSFTQPLMYKIIDKHPTLRTIYAKRLDKEGILQETQAEEIFKKQIDELQNILARIKEKPPKVKPDSLQGRWKNFKSATHQDLQKPVDTSVSMSVLKSVGERITTLPLGFTAHPKILKLIERRQAMVQGKEPLDWGTAELLSYGSLLTEGTSVRLSGQDVVRGTFTHRHSAFFDFNTGEMFCPLKEINADTTEFCVYNSLLSEMAVLGFEYGNSIGDPYYLTIWEAQFGDFANGAQVIIDQFLSSGEAKWQRMSGLVLLLPHGYEGQGPEHSSARLERYLQLCAQDNIQVCNLTTPAQIFHVFRRQMKRDFRKPLIIMSPKSLLRHPKAVNTMEELAQGQFKEVIDDTVTAPEQIERLIFCTGKVFYEIDQARKDRKVENTAIIRIEQLYPFAEDLLAKIIKSYPNAKELIWAQEEPKNMGAYFFMKPFLEGLFKTMGRKNAVIEYRGRPERASPATGYPSVHNKEQAALVNSCFE